MSNAITLAQNDLFGLRELLRLQANPNLRPRLRRWRPDREGSPHRADRAAATPYDAAPPGALLMQAPYNVAARQHELALALETAGLDLRLPFPDLQNNDRYQVFDHLTGYETIVSLDAGDVVLPRWHGNREALPGTRDGDLHVAAAITVRLTFRDAPQRDVRIPFAAFADPFRSAPATLFASGVHDWRPEAFLAYLTASTFRFFPDDTKRHHNQLKAAFEKEAGARLARLDAQPPKGTRRHD